MDYFGGSDYERDAKCFDHVKQSLTKSKFSIGPTLCARRDTYARVLTWVYFMVYYLIMIWHF